VLDAGSRARGDGKAELQPATGSGEPDGLVEEFETQGGEGLEDVVEGPLQGARAAGCASGDLEAADQVEGEGAEKLPGSVGVAVVGDAPRLSWTFA